LKDKVLTGQVMSSSSGGRQLLLENIKHEEKPYNKEFIYIKTNMLYSELV
jgi:hypothetical protein